MALALDNGKVMKMSKKLLSGCLVIAAVISGLTLISASAESVPMTGSQIDQIRNNCDSTKSTLNQLHASDALMRVNRGQTFESMATKLMDRFNSRLSSNNYNNAALVSVTNNYDTMLDTFRSDYKTYEEQLSATLNIDCSNQPEAFYNAVASARTKRNQVHTDVVKLNQLIDQYQTAVNQFEKDYQTAASKARQ